MNKFSEPFPQDKWLDKYKELEKAFLEVKKILEPFAMTGGRIRDGLSVSQSISDYVKEDCLKALHWYESNVEKIR